MVAEDTLTTAERDFLRAAAPQGAKINKVLQDYALELKGSVPRDLKEVPAAWTTELMRRLSRDSVKLDVKFEPAERTFLTRDLAQRATRMAYGDAAAKLRIIGDDKPLMKAIELLQRSTSQAQLLAAAPEAARKP
jgi:hypothetical protein